MQNVTPRGRQNRTLLLALAVIVLVLIARACFPGANAYEKIAAGMTQALQRNDVAAVQQYQNAETATEVTRGRVGHASDVLTPLGKLKRTKEATPAGDGDRVHEFDLTFERGAVHEKMKLDPQNKVVRFQYDVTAAK